ncbi:MAG TPA: dihydrolipoyl dehydrogenase [Methylocella sp.]|nr:dihydrolipoyl dehydrogenase [Methylocella sp.]
MAETYDILIIGGGPGGYVAAIRAAQLGLRTAVVEREHLGGICLNWGCIPTKALLRSAEVYQTLTRAKDFGLTVEGQIGFDSSALVARSRAVAAQLNKGVDFLLRKNKVAVIFGEARIVKPGEVLVTATQKPPMQPQPPSPKDSLAPGTYLAQNIIIATGARPRILPGIEPDGKLIWTYFEAMLPDRIPDKLIIVGSGAIGIEFASFYRSFGTKVTVVEILPQILPAEDEEIAAFARKRFEKQGIEILTSTKVTKVEKKPDSLTATLEDTQGATRLIEAERLISAIGVTGNWENLGLEALGVAIDHGIIQTDGLGRTNVPGIFAIGDIAGPPMLAHKAEHEGVICVEAIKGLDPPPLDKLKIPGCTFCFPQIASVGLTESKAKAQGYEVRIGRFPFIGNGKAIALGEPEGLVKTLFDAKTGQLLGAHLVGAEVTELIQGFVIAMNCETTETELIETIFPHPTLSETMHESVLSAYGRAIHF